MHLFQGVLYWKFHCMAFKLKNSNIISLAGELLDSLESRIFEDPGLSDDELDKLASGNAVSRLSVSGCEDSSSEPIFLITLKNYSILILLLLLL